MLRGLAQVAVAVTVAAPGWEKVVDERDVARWGDVGALIQAAWYEGEARERGISVGDDEARAAADEPRGKLTRADAIYQAKVGLLAARIRDQIVQPAALSVTQDQIDAYVAANPKQLDERRRVRIVETASRRQAVALRKAIRGGLTWRAAARRHRSGTGAPRTVENDTGLGHAIFKTKRNEVRRYGSAVFKVVAIIPPRPQPLAQQRAAAWEVLAGQAQQEALATWLPSFQTKWRERTACAPAYATAPEC